MGEQTNVRKLIATNFMKIKHKILSPAIQAVHGAIFCFIIFPGRLDGPQNLGKNIFYRCIQLLLEIILTQLFGPSTHAPSPNF